MKETFWAVSVVGLIAAAALYQTARGLASKSPVWASVQAAAVGFLCLFALHIAALSFASLLMVADVRISRIYATIFRLAVVFGSFALVLGTPVAAFQRADSNAGWFVRSTVLAASILAIIAPLAFFLCVPYMLD